MTQAPRYLLERWRTDLELLFDEPDANDALDWLIANHERKRVILVGSGFSKNAKNDRSLRIPLWDDISAALADDMRISPRAFDALSLADFHRRNQGESAFQQRLLSLLDDQALEPGEAHAALWRSKPEAVITTNFLDTLLERDVRALSVIEDPDLALPIDEGRAQVVYLHGHRSNFASWVAGRSDYDDLQDTRPMLFARTRQLFAQFPLLVVGYSLTDPDFHLVYRQMVRAMNRRHPMGLAVMLQRNGEDAAQAERVAKKYWEDLGLRIVRFRMDRDISSNEQFVRFFDLTQHVETPRDLEACFRSSPSASWEDVREAFHANAEIAVSALQDPTLDRIWHRSFEARATFWRAALNRALPEAVRTGAANTAQKFNLDTFRRPRSADGSAPQRAQTHERAEASFDLERASWAPGVVLSHPLFEPVWT
jgi:hypothetical protein